jgi:hypothetical protein
MLKWFGEEVGVAERSEARFYTITRQFGYAQRVAIGPYLYLAIVRNAF